MKLRQLQYVHEVVRSGLNISRAAQALHTSQPGISQQIRALEEELRIDIFSRDKNRLVALTPSGEYIAGHIATVLAGIRSIEQLARSSAQGANEELHIVATHTQARYILPDALKTFSDAHPEVSLSVTHCNTDEIIGVLLSGNADIAVTPIDAPDTRDILVMRCREFSRVVLVPVGHPLLLLDRVELDDIARYPLIMYDHSIPTRQQYLDIFSDAGITPNVVLNAINSDVMKACVENGLGITILPEFVFSPQRDVALRSIDAGHIFPPAFTNIAVHRKRALRKNMFNFIHLLAPELGREQLERDMRGT